MSSFKRAVWIGILIVLIPICGFVSGVGLLRAIESLSATPPLREGDFSSVTAAVGSPVVLLSTSTCPWCEKARVWLDGQGIAYRDCVVDKDAFAADMLDRAGGDSVPQLLNTERAASGYEPELFARIVQEATPQHREVQRCSAPTLAATDNVSSAALPAVGASRQ